MAPTIVKDPLDAIFCPDSIAVIGASTQKGKVGHDIFVNILQGGFQGVLYPVNPKARNIGGVRAYKSISEIPDTIDLAMVILPGMAALKAVTESIVKGVHGIVINSAGFREVGGEGREIEDEIVRLCRDSNVRLIGPNCLGVINPQASISMNASFSARMPKFGNISFISQSGALCTAVLDFAAELNVGFSKFISIGNKADVDELDLLQYLHKDPETDVILMYVEELRRGPEFITKVKEITCGDRPTPILVIKSGRTVAGAAAAASHTGSLAGTEAVYDAIFKQSGILRVNTIDELFDCAQTFASKGLDCYGQTQRKVLGGNRLAIVTNAGGPGIVATDMTVSCGLDLAQFSEETVEALASHLPNTANLHNPVDVIGDASADRYENSISAVIKDEGVDAIMVILTPQSMTNVLGTAEAIVKISRCSTKPIVCCFMGIVDVSAGVKFLQSHHIPCFKFPENCARSLGALYRYSAWLNRQHLAQFTNLKHDKETAAAIINKCLKEEGRTQIGEVVGYKLLQCYGFKTMPTELATTSDEAVEFAEQMGYPVVMKISSPQILHKTDAKGVMVKLQNADAVRDAFETIVGNAKKYNADAVIEGVVVQKMASGEGVEVILGATRYPIFGHLLMFGIGGIFVEVFQDVEFKLAPILRNEAHRMVSGIKGYKMLQSFRGRQETDIQEVEKCLVSLSEMVTNHPEIAELDINPMVVYSKGQGVAILDCRMILKEV